ncbi:MAG: NAD(P)-binding domain-containing protein, partial [Salinibacterium sp.]|nr:NAD(P)-binding domain-containing protein [Salinibacterium sp.]
MSDTLDALIVGAGPIGLETAWAINRAGGRAVVVDRGAIGSTMRWWAPGTKFFSSPERIAIAGVPMAVRDQEKATREDYLGYLVQVAQTHALDVRTFTEVLDVSQDDDGLAVAVCDARTGADQPGLCA